MSAMTNNKAYLFIYKSFCLIAPEPNPAKTVIHIVIQKTPQNKKKPQQKYFYCGLFVVPPAMKPNTS